MFYCAPKGAPNEVEIVQVMNISHLMVLSLPPDGRVANAIQSSLSAEPLVIHKDFRVL